jgi:hypothetical protein
MVTEAIEGLSEKIKIFGSFRKFGRKIGSRQLIFILKPIEFKKKCCFRSPLS